MADGQIVFEITADGRHARADIQELTRVIRQETQQWSDDGRTATDDISGGFSSMLKKIGSAITAAKIGQKLLEIGKEAINLASDLQEVQNVVDTTFGRDASKIDDWAKKAATQFGLTEIQAKQFTSTLGAMMKSSGLAGSEITEMSTDLAGLAADMASFYNLDFDTAFQKIRSGISGETEPLKQLGINMSVANLNAYALEKGLGKTFEQMTQGEQVMLRYQYLMDATADAQGDFARTSDGYANSLRALETNITSLKTKIGNVLLPAINDVVGAINGLFGSDAEEKANKFSILDRINEINIEKENKIAEINEIVNTANSLIEVLGTLAGNTSASDTMKSLATGANSLDASSKTNWTGILGALRGINGLENLFGEGETATQTVSDLADALSGQSITTTKAQAWDTFLSALGDNADAVSALTGDTVEGTKEWLKGMAETAKQLSPDDAAAWQTLMTSLVSGIDLNTEGGQAFVEQLAAQFLAMGSGSDEAVAGLAALGYTTEDIEAKQAAWLAVCKELTETIPGISDLIDTQTGEIKGGLPALRDYVEQWQEAERIQAEINALGAMKDVYNQENNIGTKRGEMMAARAVYKLRLQEVYGVAEQEATEFAEFMQKVVERGITLEGTDSHILSQLESAFGNEYDTEKLKRFGQLYFNSMFSFGDEKLPTLFSNYMQALDVLITTEKELPIVNQEIDDGIQALAESTGYTVEQLQAMTETERQALTGMTKLERAAAGDSQAIEEIGNAAANATEALKALADHVDSVHDKIIGTLDGLTSGFEKIETPMMKKNQEMRDLKEQINNLDKSSKTYEEDLAKLNEQMNKAGAGRVTAQSMGANLKQQAEYMDTYLANLRKARELGVSDEILAQLSDGSEESYDYLAALAEATPKQIEKINAGFEQVAQKKKELADELTSQQLTVDETYKTLAEAAKAAVAELDLEEEAAANAGKTVGGIAQGIAGKVPALQTAVDEVCAQLSRLEGWGISLSLGNFGTVRLGSTNPEGSIHGGETIYSHKMGLDYVPFDNYFARLHEGEAVLTAEENKVWQHFRNGGLAGVDYDSLGGVMRENIRPGGNVYMNGRIVGQVLSEEQGNQYRNLQRSGWQQ